MIKRLLFLIIFSSFVVTKVDGQEKCGTVELQELHLGKTDYREDEKRFENWLSKRMQERQEISFSIGRISEVVQIPVVVHIIHKGQALGQNSNIPDAQIQSQIDILNADFRRLNADASETPQEFLSVAADSEIEFVLAKQDPEGLPTTGIVRKQGSQFEYNLFDDDLLKSESFWPTEDYLNIWVTDLSNDLLGYAQFPVSNLSGLTVDRDNQRLTDGVVVDYEYFGTGFNNDPFSRGRTATHEIGHFLGLRHVWGDGGCSVDDFCLDTPQMSDNTSGCPGSQDSCDFDEFPDMFQNYMDFTDDVCMNLFTICQAKRMQTILTESPRRRTLLNSKGGQDPVIVANDIGIRQIISPEVSVCTNTITPEVQVRNYGNNIVASFKIDMVMDGTVIQSSDINLGIDPLNLLNVVFEAVTVEPGTEMNISFLITEVNGATDGNPVNDTLSQFTQVPAQIGFPVSGNFETGNDNWMTRKLTGEPSNWQISNAPLSTSDNQAYNIDIFSSGSNQFGDVELMLSQ